MSILQCKHKVERTDLTVNRKYFIAMTVVEYFVSQKQVGHLYVL